MGALRNRRREKFARELAGGKTAIEAMELAGYAAAAPNARRLANSKDVKERVAELYRHHVEFLSVDIARVLIEQSRIAYANMADFWERDEDGAWCLKDLSKLPRELMACIREIKIGKDGEPQIKLHDKAGALAALQRYLDPDPLPPGQRDQPPGAQPAAPAYGADDDFADLVQPQPARVMN